MSCSRAGEMSSSRAEDELPEPLNLRARVPSTARRQAHGARMRRSTSPSHTTCDERVLIPRLGGSVGSWRLHVQRTGDQSSRVDCSRRVRITPHALIAARHCHAHSGKATPSHRRLDARELAAASPSQGACTDCLMCRGGAHVSSASSAARTLTGVRRARLECSRRCNRRANRRPAGKTPSDAGRWTTMSDIWLNPWRVSRSRLSRADTLLLAEARTSPRHVRGPRGTCNHPTSTVTPPGALLRRTPHRGDRGVHRQPHRL